MKARSICLLAMAGVMAGGVATARADCLRMRVSGEGTAKQDATEARTNPSQAAHEAAKHAMVAAIHDWEKTVIARAGSAYGSYAEAQDKVESCKPLYRNLMSPVKCVVTATPCTPTLKP